MSDTATVLICAYNEAPRVGAVVEAARGAALGPVVVVDDGSSDETAAAAERFGARVVRHDVNRGKGAALATGLEQVASPLTVLVDADLTGLTSNHIQQLVEPLDANIPLASRGVLIGGRWATSVAQTLAPNLSGQRGFRTDDLRALGPFTESGYGVEVLIERGLKQLGIQQTQVRLRGVGQVMKEEKASFAGGARTRLQMYVEIGRQLLLRRRSG